MYLNLANMTNQDIRSFFRLGLLKFRIANKWKIRIIVAIVIVTQFKFFHKFIVFTISGLKLPSSVARTTPPIVIIIQNFRGSKIHAMRVALPNQTFPPISSLIVKSHATRVTRNTPGFTAVKK